MVSFSVLIITHGREELLLKCLDSLRPSVENWQLIIVANGLPLSETVIQKAHSLTSEVDILDLPKQETPGKTRNEGIKLVKHEWVFFIEDDAYVYPRYFETALPLLAVERIDVFGGPVFPAKGMDNFSQALEITLSSPFCAGKTFRRHNSPGKQMIPADEVILSSCNLWIRTQLLREVPFPENYLRAEDIALLLDLQKRGTHMFYHPALVVAHYYRRNFKSLFNPTFESGYFRSKVLKDKDIANTAFFWLPAIFVLFHLFVFIAPELFITMARIYFGIIVMMSLNLAARRRKMSLFAYIAILHYYIVFVYGLGFLAQRLGIRR